MPAATPLAETSTADAGPDAGPHSDLDAGMGDGARFLLLAAEAVCGAGWLVAAAPRPCTGVDSDLVRMFAGQEMATEVHRSLLAAVVSPQSPPDEPPASPSGPQSLQFHDPGLVALWLWTAGSAARTAAEWLTAGGHAPATVTPLLAGRHRGGWFLAPLGVSAAAGPALEGRDPDAPLWQLRPVPDICWQPLQDVDASALVTRSHRHLQRMVRHIQPGTSPKCRFCWRCSTARAVSRRFL